MNHDHAGMWIRIVLPACLLLGLAAACDSGGTGDGPMTAETADLTGTYVMVPASDSDDPFVGAGTIDYEMTAVALDHRGTHLSGTANCRWTFTAIDPLAEPLTQLGEAELSGSYQDGFMELRVEGSNCPKGSFAGTWTNPDTLVFGIGSYFDGEAPLVLLLQEAGD